MIVRLFAPIAEIDMKFPLQIVEIGWHNAHQPYYIEFFIWQHYGMTKPDNYFHNALIISK